MTILPRKCIRNLKPYEPGKPIKELARELGIKESGIIKLASNENPLGPSPKALKAILAALKEVNRYPDGNSFYLKQKLASKLNLKQENIVLGNGSDELIEIVIKAFLEDKDEVIISEPSFLEYKIIARTRGLKVKIVPMIMPLLSGAFRAGQKCFKYDISRILKSISKNTKLIFFGNPDNPTGAYLNRHELIRFLRACPKNIIIVFDEAYRELIEEGSHPNLKDYIHRGNIIVLRTFSKTYGLAGLRIGYAITNKTAAAWLERVRQPFNVNLLAQAGAQAALDDKEHLAKSRKAIRQGRSFLNIELKRLGFDVIEMPANFLLFSYKGVKGDYFFKKFLPFGVIIRNMRQYGLPDWARVSVGTMQENRRFIATLSKVITQI